MDVKFCIYICTQMKKIAIIILFLFTISHALPTAQSLLDGNTIMLVDYTEEHKSSKEDLNEKKEYKEYITHNRNYIGLQLNSLKRLCFSEYILPAPSVDKLTPPPNFC